MEKVTRNVSCIVCPMGCTGQVVIENGEVISTEGFNCPRGKQYATEEVIAPKRMLTTTVRLVGGKLPLLPVVSRKSLPKEKIRDCVACLAAHVVKAPIKEGQIITANILNLGIDIVASRDIDTY